MIGARKAVAQGLDHIETQVFAIEEAVSDNPGLAFDLAKTLIESTCRTILKERDVPYGEDDSPQRLFGLVRDNLPMLPPEESHEAGVRRSITQTLGGINTAVQGITQLRNQLGFASHGSDSPRPSMDTAHAILAAQTADVIIGFLYHMHTQRHDAPDSSRNEEFDQHIDEIHQVVQIFEVEFFASDVLFQMDRQAYSSYRVDFLAEPTNFEEEQ